MPAVRSRLVANASSRNMVVRRIGLATHTPWFCYKTLPPRQRLPKLSIMHAGPRGGCRKLPDYRCGADWSVVEHEYQAWQSIAWQHEGYSTSDLGPRSRRRQSFGLAHCAEHGHVATERHDGVWSRATDGRLDLGDQ